MTKSFVLSEGDYTLMKFPSGELNVTLTNYDEIQTKGLVIKGSIFSSDDLMELCLLVAAIRQYMPLTKLVMVMPYCAYSRQDRSCNKGEAFSLKVFTTIINSLDFVSIMTFDNHSDVSTALLNNCINVTQKDILEVFKDKDVDLGTFDYIISPDAGANKKAFEVVKSLEILMLRADKVRDTATGKILETIMYATPEQLHLTRVLVVDDICDGGRTFIELAKAIKAIQPECSICLYVTHGFFSKGIESLLEDIDHIYTTTSVCSLDSTDKLTVVDLFN